VAIALALQPNYVTLVPEKREEVTTEGGLDVAGNLERLCAVVDQLQSAGIPVSLFIDAETAQIQASAKTQAQFIELHTGKYADAPTPAHQTQELAALVNGCATARSLGLRVNAGHGLTYQNVYPVAQIAGMEELNIGHSIISRAVFVGLERAVREMKQAMFGNVC
ncbi:MAG: pyridoxine 5'-phosphate synthase, partial [Microcystaceae cyanobacterium]